VNKQLRLWREDGIIDIEEGFIVLRRPAELRTLTEPR
jgi:hypothetical protein